MIAKILSSKIAKNVLGYDFGATEKDQRIFIIGYEGVMIKKEMLDMINKNWSSDETKHQFKLIAIKMAKSISLQFSEQAKCNDRVKNKTGHIALSFSPADRARLKTMTPEEKMDIVVDYLDAMGITDTQYVVTEHFDTHAPHFHVAYNRVKYDGTVVKDSFERYRSVRVAKELTEKYKLAKPNRKLQKLSSIPSYQRKYAALKCDCLECLAKSSSHLDFTSALKQKGIDVIIHTGKKIGLVFVRGKIRSCASKLSRQLTFQAIDKQFEKGQEGKIDFSTHKYVTPQEQRQNRVGRKPHEHKKQGVGIKKGK